MILRNQSLRLITLSYEGRRNSSCFPVLDRLDVLHLS